MKMKYLILGCMLFIGTSTGFFGTADVINAAPSKELIEGAKNEGEVEVYATLGIEDATRMVTKFQETYPFVKVKLTRADSEKLLTRVLLEARAQKNFTDVIQTVGFSMHTFMKKGVLESHTASEDRFYPNEFKERPYWTAAYVNPYVVAYNTKLIAAGSAPKIYADLLKPAWLERS